ncbi:alcohol dehydrogenase catalytic domain-containing protein [Rhodococcus opacus]|uniref:alcohol dehydrogenase catalytic domain-containing protein n=1 Tax=Rhodococcus opacus TaxID=37919 RepID=UPI0007CD9C02|nr:alcohol dehydrogenase catalytic domain-containing protein [Rhodococcus opacus]MDX5969897.1 alcohol dehydrogenase catalytic domain-containing protein [Rhodococcus opacus]NKY76903.1 alcohol dehydrogenase catalytic domain-containing protein [Rhodococcus opacus]CAG7631436.1 putative zinc-binding alcohol dehydrogenase [Rhodococcus opacus]
MRAAVYHGPKDVRIEELADPRIEQPGDVIIKMITTSMCGSDLYLYNGEVEELVAPGHTTLGHEICGEVVEVGSAVNRFAVGDRVTFPYSVSCGRCESCRVGQTAHCLTSGKAIYGFGTAFGDLGGSHAEYVRAPLADDHLEHVPDSLPDDVVPFLSCNLPAAAIAVHAAEIELTDTVAVVGCGATGLLALDLIRRHTNATVYAFDPVPFRRKRAELLGAVPMDASADAVDTSIQAVLDATQGLGVHKVVEFAGRGGAFDLSVALARPGGTISGGGVYLERDHPVSLFDMHFKNLRLVLNGFANARTAQWHAMQLIENSVIDPTAVLTHRVSLYELPSTAEQFTTREEGFLKALITP